MENKRFCDLVVDNVKSLKELLMNKRFCDLVVGDKIYIFYRGEYIEKEVTATENDGRGFLIVTRWESYVLIHQKDKDFFINEYSVGYGIQEAIATSLDKLCLECEN